MDYYKKTLKTIEDLINNGNEAKALGIIDEELSMPYLPMDFEKELRELKLGLKKSEESHLLSSENELRRLLNGSLEQQMAALNNLKALNCRNYIQLLSEFFIKAPDARVAGLLIDILIAQGITKEFAYLKADKLLTFQAAKLCHPYEVPAFHNCNKEIHKLLDDNYPQERQMAEDLLLYYSYVILPDNIKVQDSKPLAEAVVYQVFLALDNLKTVETMVPNVEQIAELCRTRFRDLQS